MRRDPGGRFSQGLREEILRRHLEAGESYRALALWLRRLTGRITSPIRLQQIVAQYAERCKTAYEMSQELRPKWNGMVLLDEKMCVVKGARQWFYVAVDTTGDILHCRAVEELSSTTAAQFVKEVMSLPVHLRGVITDMDPSLTRALSIVCPETPHQYCIKHALTAIGVLIEYAEMRVRRDVIADQRWNSLILREQHRPQRWKRKRLYQFDNPLLQQLERVDEKAALYQASRAILTATTDEQAEQHFVTLKKSVGYSPHHQKKVVRFFRRHWEKLMMHHKVSGMPRTTNMVESVNKQLQRRYKTIEAFQYTTTAIHYTNLLVAFLRQKAYTDCRGDRKHLNGKSRLESARVKHLSQNWLHNCLKNIKKQQP